jgi:NADPH:quinone reductase-like Zn-dependent oxidoreductase
MRLLKVVTCLVALVVNGLNAPAMKAVRVDEFGDRSVLKVTNIGRPEPGAGELLVRVHAASVNPVDWKMRQHGDRMGMKVPFTPGFDVSGVIESVGPGVTKFRAGDAIFAMLDLRRGGAYAEYAIVKESEAAMKPAKTSHVDAAAVPLVALTAWQALFDTAKLEKGQTVLIHGGSGGVGSFAVQLAKAKGAKVIATASKENLEFLKQLGADEAIDYRAQKFDEIVKEADVVLDTVGGDTQQRSFAVLKKSGMLVSIVGQPSKKKADEAGVRVAGILVKANGDELAEIGKMMESGAVKSFVSMTLPLTDVAKAHEQSETGHTRGKIVLRVADESK